VSINRVKTLKESNSSPDTFTFVRDGQAISVVDGAVVKLDNRELTFRAEMHVGEEVAGLGLTAHITRLSKADKEAMLADGTLKTEDADGVLRVDRPYWEMLLRTLIVRPRGADGFRVQLERDQDRPVESDEPSFSSIEVLRGKIVAQDSRYLYI